MLTVLSVWALVRVGNGSAPVGHLTPSLAWFNPFKVKHFSDFIVGLADMLFIYWGWDTALNLNEETDNAEITPGKAGVISTFFLLGIYALVIFSVQSFAGIGSHGIGLGNANHANDVLSILGPAIFWSLHAGVDSRSPLALDGALFGGRVHANHDLAHRPHGAVDGRAQGRAQRLRQDAQALSYPDRRYSEFWRGVDWPLRRHELLVGGSRHQ
jgi:hypothetical protein